MADEKPFEATPYRIRKARREGNVARSGQLAANQASAILIDSTQNSGIRSTGFAANKSLSKK